MSNFDEYSNKLKAYDKLTEKKGLKRNPTFLELMRNQIYFKMINGNNEK